MASVSWGSHWRPSTRVERSSLVVRAGKLADFGFSRRSGFGNNGLDLFAEIFCRIDRGSRGEPFSFSHALGLLCDPRGGRFGGRELVLFEAENLPICFYMGRTLPYYQTREQLAGALAKRPDLVVIWEQQKKSQSPPPGQEKLRIHMRKRDIVLFEQK